jgi:hypothetical protein
MRNFFKNTRGALVVELMIILPTLFLVFMAMIVFFDAFHKWMKFTTASYTITDLISRQTVVDDNFLFSLDGVFDTISDAKNETDTWFRVSSIKKNDSALSILWSVHTSPTTQLPLRPVDIDSYVPNISINEHLLIIETFSPFTPAFDWVGLNDTFFTETIATSSRFSSKLANLDHLDYDDPSDDGIDDPLN